MINLKTGGIIVAAFIAGAFVASPELRAYAANTVGSSDIIDESILSRDIKNGQVKKSDIAADAVGASELVGVTKLIFTECAVNNNNVLVHGGTFAFNCHTSGVEVNHKVIATNKNNGCYGVTRVNSGPDNVNIALSNNCASPIAYGSGTVSIIVYDT
jgi:hypothetical protein